MDEPNEESIINETKHHRCKVTVVLCVLLIIFLLAYFIIITKYFPEVNVVKYYTFGIIFGWVGLILRSIEFRNYADYDKKEKILKLEKQKEIIDWAYYIKYPVQIFAYTLIFVFTIKELLIGNLCEAKSDVIWLPIVGGCIIIGFTVSLKYISDSISKLK